MLSTVLSHYHGNNVYFKITLSTATTVYFATVTFFISNFMLRLRQIFTFYMQLFFFYIFYGNAKYWIYNIWRPKTRLGVDKITERYNTAPRVPVHILQNLIWSVTAYNRDIQQCIQRPPGPLFQLMVTVTDFLSCFILFSTFIEKPLHQKKTRKIGIYHNKHELVTGK